MKPKEKILGRISELITQADELKKQKYDSEDVDLWRKKVKKVLDRLGGETLINEYKRCIYVPFSVGDFDLRTNTFESSYSENERQDNFLEENLRIKNLLIVVKEDIELFGDEKTEKKAREIRRHFEAEAGIPGFIKAKWGAEEK